MRERERKKMSLARPLGVKILLPIQLVLAAISIPSGMLLLSSPSGSALGAQTILPHLHQQLPSVTNFTPVGFFLLIVYGLLPLALAYGLWTQRRIAWLFTLILGIIEIVWIGAEILLFYDLGFFIFYPIIAGMGFMTVLLCVLPSVRKYYDSDARKLSFVQSPVGNDQKSSVGGR
jgi:hypothetical protein